MPCRPSAPPVMLENAFGQLVQQQRDAERHHQPRQVGAADDEEAGEEAEHRRDETGDDQAEHRLGDDAMLSASSPAA